MRYLPSMLMTREGPTPVARYASVNLTPGVVAALRQATLTASLAADRRITQSEVVAAALAIAASHPDELRAALADATDSPGPGGPE